MKVSWLCLIAISSTSLTVAQNPLSDIISDIVSVYTEVNSFLNSAASAASAATSEASSSATETTDSFSSQVSSASPSSTFEPVSSTNPPTSSSSNTYSTYAFGASTPSSTTSSSAARSSSKSSSSGYPTRASTFTTISTTGTGSSTVLGAAAETSTATPPESSNHDHKLAIILGCVLGALALGLIILALVLCCKRRRHGSSPRHSALSLGDDEVDGWRKTPPPGMLAAATARRPGHERTASGAAPLMAEHPAYRDGVRHQNPFAPVPPPPRRSPPNMRSDLAQDMTYSGYGGNPFADEHVAPAPNARSISPDHHSHHKGGVAAGVTAAAAGAGLMHHHNKHKHDDEKTLTDERYTDEPQRQPSLTRKPVPVNHVNHGEAWPYSPVSPVEHIDDVSAIPAATRTTPRPSNESRRSYSRDAARANAAFDQQYAPRTSQEEHHRGIEGGVAALAVGAAGGAAMAHHHNKDRSRSRSSSNSGGRRRSQPPPTATAAGEDSDHSNSSSDRSGRGTTSRYYADALASQPQAADNLDGVASPENNLYNVPAAAPRSTRRNSSLGAPMLYTQNRPTMPSPLSSEVRHDSPPRRPAAQFGDYRRRSSSNPRPRNSLPFEPMSHDYGAYPSFPSTSTTNNRASLGGLETFPSYNVPAVPPEPADPYKNIVGDNGYPHMGVPRRRSGGEYDIPQTGPLGPQALAEVPASRKSQDGGSRNATMKTIATSSSGSGEEEWRMSRGMPGGWTRNSPGADGRRQSGDGGRRRMRASDVGGGGGGQNGYGWAV